MVRILVYSHDTFGLGNIRRMLAIATHLAGSLEQASILVLSGSPMLQSFRIAPQIDYIKLPSVTRTEREGYATRSLGLATGDTFELRANLMLAAVADFRPDVILVDKKPFGVENELEAAIYYTRTNLPRTATVLVLRDILDAPAATIRSWNAAGFTDAIDRFYDSVVVLGSASVFDVRREYHLPESVCDKLRFCGYVRRSGTTRSAEEVRRQLGIEPDARLILVTPGGGQDGARILSTYVSALPLIHQQPDVRSLIVTGPEMDPQVRTQIEMGTAATPGALVREFTDDMLGCMNASDLVVCMGGYNTICEVATLGRRALVVPRVHPVEEQLIRAARLHALGVLRCLHPDTLDEGSLAYAVHEELAADTPLAAIDLDALPRLTAHIQHLVRRKQVGHARVRPHVAAAISRRTA